MSGPRPARTFARAGERSLERAIGVRALAASLVGYVVGSGIFVLPAAVAAILGPAALLAYLACAAVIGLIALCFAECGSRVAVSGGPYTYVEAAFGPYAGAVAGALALLSTLAGTAAVANVCVASTAALWPVFGEPAVRAGALVLLYAALAALNLRGVGAGARLVEWATAAKLAPLALLGVVGALHVEPANLLGWQWPTAAGLGAATLVLVFAFIGIEGGLTPGAEVRDPARTVPRAIALAVLTVAALYGLLQFAAQGVLGTDLPGERAAPLAALAERIAGTPGGVFVLAAAVVSTFGYVASDAFAAPRLVYGLAADGTLPRALARVDPRTHAPRTAILAYAAVAGAVAVSGRFEALMLVSVVATLLLYAGAALATLRLRARNVRLEDAPFVAPGGPAVPLLAFAASAWLLAQASWQELAASGVVVAAVTAWYLLRRRLLRRRDGAPAAEPATGD